MSVNSCSISEYKTIPSGCRLVSVSFLGEDVPVNSSNAALRAVCEILIRKGKLRYEDARRFPASWLGVNSLVMTFPAMLPQGIYFSQDGTESTPLIRIGILLKRLMISADSCRIFFDENDIATDEPDAAQIRPEDFLEEWDAAEDEPDNAVQKRLHEFTDEELKSLVPYKVGIGNRRYVVRSWYDVANSFIAYLFLFWRQNGPLNLLAIQNSSSWHHKPLVKKGDVRLGVLPVDESDSVQNVHSLLTDLILETGFDRYSFYIKAVSGELKPVPNKPVECAPVEHDDGAVGLTEPSTQLELPLDAPGPDHGQPKVHFGIWRHLRPVFSIAR